ncbi:protoporphyrinogen oxidase [Skermania sp. ID1734]|uniref:protoporphyrinogen oxidase n=1 Tax=Skermania sp. ID1734 TaxID=2597516 RepID=UPI001180674A|nr:protoporphyrinogen oxidase [Skermania sp. ID1734]TSD96009.1 protoporphyrinogen oxidase [Skermania sp. ID1734]
MNRFAVVGGGISGLTAAYRLRELLGPGASITLIEREARTGGQLHTVSLAGEPFDVGAEAFVGRRPEVPKLLAELGLADQLVHPSGLRPRIWAGSALHPMPAQTLMGIPSSADSMAGLVDRATLDTIAREQDRPLHWKPGTDRAIGALVAERFGEQVVRRSVDPLLGGVYAGSADGIGIRAGLPTLAAALDSGAESLTAAVGAALPPPQAGPVFGGIRGGYRVLLDALTRHARLDARVGVAATTIARQGDRWSVGPIGDFDAVILAVPAAETARLLAVSAPRAAAAAAAIPAAGSALVALAFSADAELPEYSGILVATGESLRAKAFTFSSRKWPHLAGRGTTLVRASFGRFGDDTALRSTDADLIGAACADLGEVADVHAEPVAAYVQRWPAGLPQYGPGHLDLVQTIESDVADLDGLEVAGSYLRGVGVPACIAAADAAARRLADSR